MKCPRHQTDLNQRVIKEQGIDQCPECEGIWIQGSVIDKLLGSGEMLKLRSLCSIRESDLSCPADSQKLMEGKIGPVAVDLCPQCLGLWLDPGELEALLQRKPITPHVSSESSEAVFGNHPVGATEQVILYSLMGLF